MTRGRTVLVLGCPEVAWLRRPGDGKARCNEMFAKLVERGPDLVLFMIE